MTEIAIIICSIACLLCAINIYQIQHPKNNQQALPPTRRKRRTKEEMAEQRTTVSLPIDPFYESEPEEKSEEEEPEAPRPQPGEVIKSSDGRNYVVVR